MRRLGCLTPFGIGGGVIAVAAVILVALLSGGTMFSPGPLNAYTKAGITLGGVTSHAALGGNCAACHSSPWNSRGMAASCLSCHTDIQAELKNPSTLHGAMPDGAACLSCHTEHKGATANITKTDLTSSFPHELLGFSLAAHKKTTGGAEFACADCHIALTQSPRPSNAYALDSASCISCHVGYQAAFMAQHRADFGDDCLACHNGVDRYTGFNHAAVSFKLEGKHVDVGCKLCHGTARAPADFTATASTCVACHQKDDEHKGAFGPDCAACHTASGWNQVTFDHNKTAFPLTGAHITTGCTDCHGNHVYKGTPTTCVACHAEPQEHLGKYGTECATCHVTSDWKQITAFDHSKTAFPLTGAHTKVVCTNCHANNVYKGTPTTCVGCHADPQVHLGQFGTDCAACHVTSAWKNVVFKHTFPLNHGGRGRIACATCHTNVGPQQFKSYTCYNCHNQGGVASSHRRIGDFSNCTRCHANG